MKITTDKVYYNGKEFIVNNWPEEPKHDVKCHSTHACNCASMAFENGANRYVVDGYDDNCPHRYQSALTRAIEEGYEVKDQSEIERMFYNYWPFETKFYTLPEPREFDCIDRNVDGLSPRIAVLLPKEEIKPAPLGEQNKYAKAFDNIEKMRAESLGESSEEQKPKIETAAKDYAAKKVPRDADRFHDSWPTQKNRHIAEIAFKDGAEWQKSFPSPTSEPPEEQEELWKLAVSFITDSHDAGLNYYLISNLKDSFTIHRKRD